jgi:hypothetical protein
MLDGDLDAKHEIITEQIFALQAPIGVSGRAKTTLLLIF